MSFKLLEIMVLNIQNFL